MHYPFTTVNFQKAKAQAEQRHVRESIKDVEVEINLTF